MGNAAHYIERSQSMIETTATKTYPDCYLHVRESRSGEQWIMPIHPNCKLDLERLLKQWIAQEFCGEVDLDGAIMPNLEGEFYGRIMTDGRPPESIVCWDGGGFYLKGVAV